MASQPMAVKLQYMRRAPVPTKATKALRSPEEAISLGESFLKSDLTSSHFKILDDEGRKAENAAIADARRRVLEQRKFSKRHVHLKAWGAPPVDSATLQRSNTPRAHPALKRDKEVTSFGRNNIDLELMPDVWDDSNDGDDTNEGRGSPSPVRLKPQQSGRVPYDFIDNLKNQRSRCKRMVRFFKRRMPVRNRMKMKSLKSEAVLIILGSGQKPCAMLISVMIVVLHRPSKNVGQKQHQPMAVLVTEMQIGKVVGRRSGKDERQYQNLLLVLRHGLPSSGSQCHKSN